MLVLYIDGITDANASSGEFFGAERLRETVCVVEGLGAQGVCDLVFEWVDRFLAGTVQYDDLAVLVVRMYKDVRAGGGDEECDQRGSAGGADHACILVVSHNDERRHWALLARDEVQLVVVLVAAQALSQRATKSVPKTGAVKVRPGRASRCVTSWLTRSCTPRTRGSLEGSAWYTDVSNG